MGIISKIIAYSIIFVGSCFSTIQFPPNATIDLDVFHNESKKTKDWTLFIFIAGDNNLKSAIEKNIEELKKVGSTHRMNIVVRIDTSDEERKFTKIFYIAQDKLIQVMPDIVMDSGNPDDFITIFSIIYKRYPAHHWGLVFWDHGIGILDDPSMMSDSPEEIDLWNILNRGICFDDSTHHYLTNKKIEYILRTTATLLGKKIDLLGCDACYMNMWEFLRLIQPYVAIAVGSQEVEDSSGWDYYNALQPLKSSIVTPEELALSIVHAYNNYYLNIRDDYTQSAIDLRQLDMLNNTIETIAQMLIIGMQEDPGLHLLVRAARKETSSFKESFFIDLYDFFHNLQARIKKYEKRDEIKSTSYQNLTDAIKNLLQSIDDAVIANKTAAQVSAHGISIYFPEDAIHSSYYITSSPEQTAWIYFLETYLKIAF